jgi:hypothetical protein
VSGALAPERIRRWWLDRPPIRTVHEAEAYVEDVQFSQLFGSDGRFPSLREVSRDDHCPRTPSGWGADLEAMWTWKDELPVRGKAWYGRLLAGKPSLLAPRLLRDLYDHPGAADDFETVVSLSPAALSVARFILVEGPASTLELRRVACAGSAKSFASAREELGRALLVTHYGTDDRRAGWPSCVLELTARAFGGLGARSRAERDSAAARTFRDTMVTASVRELSRAFGWSAQRASLALAGDQVPTERR